MAEQQDFISWTYDPAINTERTTVILDLVRFIREGARDQGGLPKFHSAVAGYEISIKAALFERNQNRMLKPLPKRSWQPASDTVELLATTILREASWGGRLPPLAQIHLSDEKLSEKLHQRLGTIATPDIGDSGSLLSAFELTYVNACRADTRLVVLDAVTVLLKLREAPEGAGALREDLWKKKIAFHRNLLIFGGLLGPEYTKVALRLVAPQTVHSGEGINFSLIEHLERDGYSPGRYLASRVDQLKDEIKTAYEAL